ncbi:hypothetical protein Ocin01_09315 [Orchesella cincta]|uniref:Uncharacterized protein n=1 Tax=Orchesella cincta TaxID=48709 RepID=A0A1D2MWM0_ORCCI|nr:hypothetical protein Ocin01_09315 [Orchesella cincta]
MSKLIALLVVIAIFAVSASAQYVYSGYAAAPLGYGYGGVVAAPVYGGYTTLIKK